MVSLLRRNAEGRERALVSIVSVAEAAAARMFASHANMVLLSRARSPLYAVRNVAPRHIAPLRSKSAITPYWHRANRRLRCHHNARY